MRMSSACGWRATAIGGPRRLQHLPKARNSTRVAALPAQAILPALAAAPIPALVAGGSVVAAALSYIIYGAVKARSPQPGEGLPAAAEEVARENAVLVFGATGRSGRELVAALLAAGCTVVAAARSADKARSVLVEQQGLAEGRQPAAAEGAAEGAGAGTLFLEGGVDITRPETLTPELFRGVTQVVCAVGAVFGRSPEGAMGFLDDMTPERVDAGGVAAIAAAAKQHLPKPARSTADVLSMRSAEDIAVWQRLDDVIMGGQSSSALAPAADGSGAVWRGDLIVEGGGFCGQRTAAMPLDLSAYDGVSMRVRSSGGQTFKLNIKTEAQLSVPEDTYQASFDTPAGGDWATVSLPWHEFVPVKRARSVPGGEPLDPSRIRQLGLVLSRFSYNGYANECYEPGPFELEISGGISAYRDPRPQIIMVSSAGVERNAKIGDDEERRKQDIPIVQLNPGGVLNYKYAGENAVRAAGLSYAVVRPTGLTNETEGAPFRLEASQGDLISGKISRDELASVVAAVATSPAAANKSFEVRRQEAADGRGVGMGPADMQRLLLGLVQDRHRPRRGLEPLPAPSAPPKPVSDERKKEILSDSRVVRSQLGGRGGRVRDEAETAAAGSLTVTSDGRAEASAPKQAGEGAAPPAAGAVATLVVEEGGGEALAPNVAEAREWVRAWRARQLDERLP